MNGHSNRDWAVELCLVFENGVEGGLMFIFLCLSRSQWTSPLKGASHYQSVCLYSLTSSFCGSWSSQTSCSEEVITLRTFMLSCCIDPELEWAFSSHASLCYCGYSLFPDLEEKKTHKTSRNYQHKFFRNTNTDFLDVMMCKYLCCLSASDFSSAIICLRDFKFGAWNDWCNCWVSVFKSHTAHTESWLSTIPTIVLK